MIVQKITDITEFFDHDYALRHGVADSFAFSGYALIDTEFCMVKKKKEVADKQASRAKSSIKKHSVAQALCAKRISKYFWLYTKKKSRHAQPWRRDIPLEDQPAIWNKLLEAARLIRKNEVDERKFVAAQFANWNGPSRTLPMVTHLCTAGSLERYTAYLYAEQCKKQECVKVSDNDDIEILIRQGKKKLERLSRVSEMDEKEILLSDPLEFTQEFLQYKGVWKRVQKRWLEVHGD